MGSQFGDFANGAQVVIDQFITSGEAKWGVTAGWSCFTARIRRAGAGTFIGADRALFANVRRIQYSGLCAFHTAQIFHLLRRQMSRSIRLPLIVVTPKSLLRHPQAISTLEELSAGRFEPGHRRSRQLYYAGQVKRVVFCSGKIYYEILNTRRERKIKDIALLRLEQLYPFPHEYIEKQIKKYAAASHIVWCQEEPGNQGAWHRIQHYMRRHLRDKQALTYALRPSSASTATGRPDIHKKQQEDVINAALNKKSVV